MVEDSIHVAQAGRVGVMACFPAPFPQRVVGDPPTRHERYGTEAQPSSCLKATTAARPAGILLMKSMFAVGTQPPQE